MVGIATPYLQYLRKDQRIVVDMFLQLVNLFLECETIKSYNNRVLAYHNGSQTSYQQMVIQCYTSATGNNYLGNGNYALSATSKNRNTQQV